MKFEIKNNEEKKEMKIIRLELEKLNNDVIALMGYDNNNINWRIMQFKNGKFFRPLGIPTDIGIETNEEGRIEEK